MTKYVIRVEEVEPHVYEYDGMFDKVTLICESILTDRVRAWDMYKLLTSQMPSYRISLTLEMYKSKEVFTHKGQY